MTKTDIALALLLWRNLNLARYAKSTGSGRGWFMPTNAGLDKNDVALEAAKKLGVKQEYLELLFDLPVMTITVKELEECPDPKPKKKPRKKWSEWKRPGAGGKDRG